MAKTTYTATLPNGETIKRTTERTYTHAVVVEYTYTDGRIEYSTAEWAGRPDLAQKNAAKRQANAAPHIGKTCQAWKRDENGLGVWFDLDYGYENIRALILPANA